MPPKRDDLERFESEIDSFTEWLKGRDAHAFKMWKSRLYRQGQDNREGAIAEAVAWSILKNQCDSVDLMEKPGMGGADFVCWSRGYQFAIEVTNISREAAEYQTELQEGAVGPRMYRQMPSKIRGKIRGKLGQSRGTDSCPLIVCVSTLHFDASRACMGRRAVEWAMTSPPMISVSISHGGSNGEFEPEPLQVTECACSVFLSPPESDVAGEHVTARASYEPISGFILGGFGLAFDDIRLYGALNPVARSKFDLQALPNVPFMLFDQWPPKDELTCRWSISEEQEKARDDATRRIRISEAGLGPVVAEIERVARSRRRGR